MRCEDLEERVERYLDDALPAPEAGAVRAHLAACRPCRERLAVFAALGSEISALADGPPARERRAAPRRLAYALAALALAASAVVSTLAVLATRDATDRAEALAAAERVLDGVLEGGVTPDEVGERRVDVTVGGRKATVLVRVSGGPGLYEVRTTVPARAEIEIAALGVGAGAGGMR